MREILKLDESCISFENSRKFVNLQSCRCWLFSLFVVSLGLVRDSNPKSETLNWTVQAVQFEISDLGFEMQDSSNFEILI